MKNFNLINILKNKEYTHFKKLKSPHQFIKILYPVIDYVINDLNGYISKYSYLKNNIHPKLIKNKIKKELSFVFNMMMTRACVYEMHLLKQTQGLIGKNSVERFFYFIDFLSTTENTIAFFNKYPILKQNIETFVDQYIMNKKLLLNRLNKDTRKIQATFFKRNLSYQLIDWQATGDRHSQGKQVVILTFKSVNLITKIVYKPRSIAIEKGINELFSWYNQLVSKNKKLNYICSIHSKSYSWCEFIDFKPCHNPKEAQRYYYRLGSILMFTHLLCGSDLHSENIIASGEYPYIVDYECFLRPIVSSEKSNTVPRHLVTQTSILPQHCLFSNNEIGNDFSVLNDTHHQINPYLKMHWENINTDEMRLIRITDTKKKKRNMPKLFHQKINILPYEKYFLKGFRQTYQVLLNQSAYLLSNSSPLKMFENSQIRILFRNTDEYCKLYLESFHPQLLINQATRNSYFAWLEQIAEYSPYMKSIIYSEKFDLNTGNIPIFYCQSTGKQVIDSRGLTVPVPIKMTGYARVKYYIKHLLGKDDLIVQQALIENSLEAYRLNKTKNKIASQTIRKKDLSILKFAKLQLDQLKKICISNGEKLFWPMVKKIDNKIWNPAFTDIFLYDGLAGIILSFAYGSIILKDSSYKIIVEKGVKSLQSTIATHKKFNCVGAFSGISGVLYVFGKIYSLWPDPNLKDEILYLLTLLPKLIKEEKYLDIISGIPGCLLVLFSLEEIIPATILYPYIHLCVEQLLIKYPIPTKFPFSEPNTQQPLISFAHGTSGVITAFAKYLSIDKNNPLVKTWIHQALNYERQAFSTEVNNWPDFRFPKIKGKVTYSNSWCHGAPGVGLSRIELKKYYKDQYIDNEINAAIKTVLKKDSINCDNLCHGNLGNIELLLQAQLPLDIFLKPILKNMLNNGIRCGSAKPSSMSGLMTGLSGISYQLLRIAKPDVVPVVLLLK